MSNETTTTSLTEIVMSEWIDPFIMPYLMDELVIAGLAYQVDISGQPTKTAAMPRWIKDAGTDVTTEGTTALANTQLDTEEPSTVTVGVVGIMREVTDLAAASNLQGEAGLMQFISDDGAKLLAEMIDDDLAALATGFATVAGEATTDLSVANLISALNSRRTNNARGVPAFVLDDQQAADLTTAIAATAATIFTAGANQSLLNGRSDGLLGEIFGVPVWYTNLTDSSGTGASVNGMLISTGASPAWASLALVNKWAPRLKSESDVAGVSTLHAITASYGVGERFDLTGVRIRTDA